MLVRLEVRLTVAVEALREGKAVGDAREHRQLHHDVRIARSDPTQRAPSFARTDSLRPPRVRDLDDAVAVAAPPMRASLEDSGRCSEATGPRVVSEASLRATRALRSLRRRRRDGTPRLRPTG
eukprot:30612-Pelagococcus_subviridis.AAC.7